MRKKKLVKLWRRASRCGTYYTYYLMYYDLDNKLRRESLGHNDERKAERQRLKKEKELLMGFTPPNSLRLSEFIQDCLRRSGNQIRPSTKTDYKNAVQSLIEAIGDIDFQTVTYRHGEIFRQYWLDQGNAPATVAKKIREIHAVFQVAIDRRQLDENPFHKLAKPKINKNTKIITYTDEECDRLVKSASLRKRPGKLEWDLVIMATLTTGMRKSEIINLIWDDIDFDNMSITVTEKMDTKDTWLWKIKDTDHRDLPLTEEYAALLLDLKARLNNDSPYVFIPEKRYAEIQHIRQGNTSKRGKKIWTYEDTRYNIVSNFSDEYEKIRIHAGIKKHKTFHDLRRTAITNWFYAGLELNEVMKIAGHSSIETTQKYYMAVKDGLIDKARDAVKFRINKDAG